MNFFRSQSTETIPIETSQIEPKNSNYTNTLISNFLTKKPSLKKTNYTKNMQSHTSQIFLQTKDGNIISAYLSQPQEVKNVLLFLHGRQTNRYHFYKNLPVDSFLNLSYAVFIPDLRGFGECNFLYNTNGFNTDLERCINFINSKYKNTKITIIGHCIGTGIALNYVKYAQQNLLIEPRIVLISPVLSEKEILKNSRLIKLCSFMHKIKEYDDFENESMKLIKFVDSSDIVIFHGSKDKVNLIEDGIKLANERGCRIYRSESDDYYSILKNEEVVRKIDDFVNEKKSV
ncbi:hypothetical protein GVAV_002656 [Gurleya vavrai]